MNIIDNSNIVYELPLLVSFTIVVIALYSLILILACRAKRLRETLRELILINKDQRFPILIYKTIYRQLSLPLKYTENQETDIHLKMIEMLEQRGRLTPEQIFLKRLAECLSCVLQRAFQSIISRAKR